MEKIAQTPNIHEQKSNTQAVALMVEWRIVMGL
jgi:hypothetical protein